MTEALHINVLYVDDEPHNLESFRASFRRHFTVFTAQSAKEAEQVLAKEEIHVIITDQKMPVTTGAQLLEKAIEKNPDQSRIILSAYTDNEAVINAFQKGLIHRFILKPFNQEELISIILTGYETYNLKKIKNKLYQDWLETQKQIELLKKTDKD